MYSILKREVQKCFLPSMFFSPRKVEVEVGHWGGCDVAFIIISYWVTEGSSAHIIQILVIAVSDINFLICSMSF